MPGQGLGETKDEYTTERPSHVGPVTPKTTRRVRSKFQQHEDEYTPGRHNHVRFRTLLCRWMAWLLQVSRIAKE
jgi:hypothetical protein